MGADSRPGVAGTRTMRFVPPAGTTSNPFSAAHVLMCATAASSWRDGRGMRESASKCFQSKAGSAPSKGSIISFTSLRFLAVLSQIPTMRAIPKPTTTETMVKINRGTVKE